MADIDLIKRNLTKMVEQGAPEADLNAYLSTEGFKSADEWRAASASPAGKPKTVGAAMVQESPRLEPGPRTSTMPDEGRPWGEVASSFARNILPTTGKAVLGSVNALTVGLPQTVEGLYDLGKGVVSKIGRNQPTSMRDEYSSQRTGDPTDMVAQSPRPPTPEQAQTEATADAVGAHYGNLITKEGFKNALADDPGSLLMDVATLGAAGAGLPGRAGQVAGIISKADPLTASVNVLKAPVTGFDVAGRHIPGAADASAHILGRTTGAGARSIQDAGSAGRELGGPQRFFPKDAQTVANADALVTNMNKGGEVQDVVNLAKSALGQGYKERGSRYREHMAEIGQIPETITFDTIDKAIGKATDVGTYKGVTTEPKAATTVKEMSDIVEGWRGLDPAEYHTPEGIDALKRTLGNIRDSTKQGSPERTAANRIYDAVYNVIVDKAPQYSEYMADYGAASKKLGEAGRTFSLTEKATGDTAARKLLSATRDNVQTNNKGRANVLDMLSEYEPTLPYAIAGQALQSPMPRGIVANGAATYGAYNVLPGILADPVSAIGTMAAFSPRVVGNVVYYGGRAIGAVEDVANALHITPQNLRMLEQGGYQAGRPEDIRQRATTLRNRNALAAP